ncbi:hypothetical protein [Thioclava sp. GXIMD4216]|uniref:hypothetical protein n=1 Tax=Thioclava sp. GXIMD4216 TaxID=3131929 RepID=UPI0030CC5EEC
MSEALVDWTMADYCFGSGLLSEEEYEIISQPGRKLDREVVAALQSEDAKAIRREADELAVSLVAIDGNAVALQPLCASLRMKHDR